MLNAHFVIRIRLRRRSCVAFGASDLLYKKCEDIDLAKRRENWRAVLKYHNILLSEGTGNVNRYQVVIKVTRNSILKR